VRFSLWAEHSCYIRSQGLKSTLSGLSTNGQWAAGKGRRAVAVECSGASHKLIKVFLRLHS